MFLRCVVVVVLLFCFFIIWQLSLVLIPGFPSLERSWTLVSSPRNLTSSTLTWETTSSIFTRLSCLKSNNKKLSMWWATKYSRFAKRCKYARLFITRVREWKWILTDKWTDWSLTDGGDGQSDKWTHEVNWVQRRYYSHKTFHSVFSGTPKAFSLALLTNKVVTLIMCLVVNYKSVLFLLILSLLIILMELYYL